MGWVAVVALLVLVGTIWAIVAIPGDGPGETTGPASPEPMATPSRGGQDMEHKGIVLGPPHRIRLSDVGLDAATIYHRGPPLVVPGPVRPLWVEKGWRREGAAFVGEYRAGNSRWPGRIEIPYPGAFVAYIWNPPLRQLTHHPHRPCFQGSRGDGRHSVHFSVMPTSPDHVISNIETILGEAIGAR